jgi:hypothetical protein
MDKKQEYEKEYEYYNSLHVKNLLNQDTVIIQISSAVLAIVAAFGKDIVASQKVLSVIVLFVMFLTIIQVIAGYFFSNLFFNFVKLKLWDNFNKNSPLNEGIEGSKSAKLNGILNISQFITFGIGMVFLIILLIVYIGSLK